MAFITRKTTPIIKSAEVTECGLACVAMILGSFGRHITLDELRDRFPVSMKGATLTSLLEISNSSGLSGRAIRVEPKELRHIRTPSIIHWNMHHFVVLVHVARNGVVIHDPAKGRVFVDNSTLGRSFTGIAVEFATNDKFRTLPPKKALQINDLWSDDRRLPWALASVALMSLALQMLAVLAPFHLQITVDQAIPSGDYSLINVLGLSFIAIAIIHACAEAGRSWSVAALGAAFSYGMIGNIVNHLLRLRASYFEKRQLGDVLSRIQSSRAIQDFLTRGAITAAMDGVLVVIALSIMIYYSVELTLLALASAAIGGAIAVANYFSVKDLTLSQLQNSAREQTHLMESIRGISTIKLMGREAAREAQWRGLFAESLNSSLSVSKAHAIYVFGRTMVRGCTSVALLWIGSLAVISGDRLTIGMLLAFLAFSLTFVDRFGSLATEIVQFRLLRVHLDRLADIVGSDAEDTSRIPPKVNSPGEISISDVSFRYGHGDREILTGINLSVAPGDYVAIMGRSGAGKTTLLKVLLGLMPPTSGEIRIGGQLADDALIRSWRSHVSVVNQEDRLMTGTIEENICFFEESPDRARIHESAEKAGVLDEIMQMPMKFRSLVGDMGTSLSAGQKQRVILARALYRRPSVLVLDEGTSNLDHAAETAIGSVIKNMGITRIVVAHRPRLLLQADRILVLENGSLRPAEQSDIGHLEGTNK